MGYRLILRLPFNIVLVFRGLFETVEETYPYLGALPNGFEPVEDTDPALIGAIPVPLRTKKVKQ